MVVAMMLMGVVLGHIAIYPVVQVLHVGMTSVLLAVTWHWIMRLWSTQSVAVSSWHVPSGRQHAPVGGGGHSEGVHIVFSP